MTNSFESSFDAVERSAKSTKESATGIGRIAARLENAAKKGEINAIRREVATLEASLNALRQQVANAKESWPFRPDEEEEYFRNNYLPELRDVASEKEGLETHLQDERLIAHPAIVRALAPNRAVRIDKRQVSTVRPSYLAQLLVKNQKRQPRFNSAAFLESLYNAYKLAADLQRNPNQHGLTVGRGPTLPLSQIYQALTLLPGSSREYDRTEFARDLHNLELNGVKRTRSGAEVFFHSTRQGGFQFVNPDGRVITYSAIQFAEP